MLALDLLGAGEGLATQAIILHVRSIDTGKLKSAITKTDPCDKCGYEPSAPKWGVALSPAVALVDWQPRIALDTALPVVKQQLARLGIDADVYTAPAPPSGTKGLPTVRDPKATKEAFVVGAVIGVILAFGGRWAYHRITRERLISQ